MSDVLLQNAFRDLYSAQRAYLANIGNTGVTLTAASFTTNAYAGTGRTCGEIGGVGNPVSAVTKYWNLIPQMTGATGSVCVYDAAGYYRCNSSCSWTVPAGVTCAQFQVWGPGGGTGTNCCCGGAPFGPTGAYASVIIPVTAGAVYTLCSGCAYCCMATQTTPGYCGTPSYVTGTGLTNFCAMSGCSDVYNWKCSLQTSPGYVNSGGCQFPTNDSCGPSACSGWNFCWDSADDSGYVSYAYSCFTKFYGSATNGTVYGINGLYPELCISSSHSDSVGFSRAAPVFGFETTSACCYTYNGSSCASCNRQGCQGYMTNPGSGGFASSVYGGCDACYGDHGRMGMVCVRYK